MSSFPTQLLPILILEETRRRKRRKKKKIGTSGGLRRTKIIALERMRRAYKAEQKGKTRRTGN